MWSNTLIRKIPLGGLENSSFANGDLHTMQQLVYMEKSDLFDVLEGDFKAMTRGARIGAVQANIFAFLNTQQKDLIEFVLSKYTETGVEVLNQEKLSTLITNKCQSLEDGKTVLGDVGPINKLFIEFQKHLDEEKVV